MSTNMTIFSTEIFEKKSFFVYFLTGEKIHVQLLELEIIKAGVSLNYSENDLHQLLLTVCLILILMCVFYILLT